VSDVRIAAPRLSCPTILFRVPLPYAAVGVRELELLRVRAAYLALPFQPSAQRHPIPCRFFPCLSRSACISLQRFSRQRLCTHCQVPKKMASARDFRHVFQRIHGSSARSCLHMTIICGSMSKCIEAPLWYSCRTSRTSLRSRCKSLMVSTRILPSDSSL
jgi:hypothetical protein